MKCKKGRRRNSTIINCISASVTEAQCHAAVPNYEVGTQPVTSALLFLGWKV